jgi:membrane dipeptidase
MRFRNTIAATVDRALHTTAVQPPYVVRPEVAAFHRSIPVVDLLVGTVLFRPTFLARRRRGHVDLPRLVDGGVNLAGMSIAARYPDDRGVLSSPHLWSLGLPARALGSGMATMAALGARIESWAAASGGRLVLVRSAPDLDAVLPAQPSGQAVPRDSPFAQPELPAAPRPVGLFLGAQGGHGLDGEVGNVARLYALGVRMIALAHVMDGPLAGSGSGRRAGGLTGLGRETVEACERAGVLVDLAHMSSTGIRETVPSLHRPFVLSHTGFVERCGTASRWRRYSAATRNVATADARLVADAGGVVGVTYATQLLGGERLADLVDTIRWAIDTLSPEHVALGSDLDGALRAVIDVAGTPLVTQGLLDAGVRPDDVAAVMGGNALRVLRSVL